MRDDLVFPQPVPFPFPWNGLAEVSQEPVTALQPVYTLVTDEHGNITLVETIMMAPVWPTPNLPDWQVIEPPGVTPIETTGTLFPTTGTLFPATGGSFTAGSWVLTGSVVTGGSLINTGTFRPAGFSGSYELGTYFQDWRDGTVTITSSTGQTLTAEHYFDILHNTVRSTTAVAFGWTEVETKTS